MPGDGGRYIQGTHRREQRRLARLNRLLNPRAVAALALEPGDRVLDMGCGTGQLTIELAQAVGADGSVLGIERDPAQLAAALRRCVEPSEFSSMLEFRRGAATRPPLKPGEWGSFDVAHCRFLLEHVDDPRAVVTALAQAVRAGGRVVLEDDDHDLLRLWPPLPEVEELWRAYIASYRQLDCDPFIGRQLVALLYAAGLVPTRCAMPPFGACNGAEDLSLYVDNLIAIFDGARSAVRAAGGISERRFDAALAAFTSWGQRPDAAFWYVTLWAEGRRPEPGDAA